MLADLGVSLLSLTDLPQSVTLRKVARQGERNFDVAAQEEISRFGADPSWRWDWTFRAHSTHTVVPIDGFLNMVRSTPLRIGIVTAANEGIYELWIGKSNVLSVELTVTERRHVHAIQADETLALLEGDCDAWIHIASPLTPENLWAVYVTRIKPYIAKLMSQFDELSSPQLSDNTNIGIFLSQHSRDERARRLAANLMGYTWDMQNDRWMRMVDIRALDAQQFLTYIKPLIGSRGWAEVLIATGSTHIQSHTSVGGRLHVVAPQSREGLWLAYDEKRNIIAIHEVVVFAPLSRVDMVPREPVPLMWALNSETPISIMALGINDTNGKVAPGAFTIHTRSLPVFSTTCVRRFYAVPMTLKNNPDGVLDYTGRWSQFLLSTLLRAIAKRHEALWNAVETDGNALSSDTAELPEVLFGTRLPLANQRASFAIMCFDEEPLDDYLPDLGIERQSPIPSRKLVDALSTRRNRVIFDSVPENDNDLDLQQSDFDATYSARAPQRVLVAVCIVIMQVRPDGPSSVVEAREIESKVKLEFNDEAARRRVISMIVANHPIAREMHRLFMTRHNAALLVRDFMKSEGITDVGAVASIMRNMSAPELRARARLYRIAGTQEGLYAGEYVIAPHMFTGARLFATDTPDSPLSSVGAFWLAQQAIDDGKANHPDLLDMETLNVLFARYKEREQRLKREAADRSVIVQLRQRGISTDQPSFTTVGIRALAGALGAPATAYIDSMVRALTDYGVEPTRIAQFSYNQLRDKIISVRVALARPDVDARFARAILPTLRSFDEYGSLPVQSFPWHLTPADDERILPLGSEFTGSLQPLCEASGLPPLSPRELPAFLMGAIPGATSTRTNGELNVAHYKWWIEHQWATYFASGTWGLIEKVPAAQPGRNPLMLDNIPTMRNLFLAMSNAGFIAESVRAIVIADKGVWSELDAAVLSYRNEQWAYEIDREPYVGLWKIVAQIRAMDPTAEQGAIDLIATLAFHEAYSSTKDFYDNARDYAYRFADYDEPDDELLPKLLADNAKAKTQLESMLLRVQAHQQKIATTLSEFARRSALAEVILKPDDVAIESVRRCLDTLLSTDTVVELLEAADLDSTEYSQLLVELDDDLRVWAVDEQRILQLTASNLATAPLEARHVLLWAKSKAEGQLPAPSADELSQVLCQDYGAHFDAILNRLIDAIKALRNASGLGALQKTGAEREPLDLDDRLVPQWYSADPSSIVPAISTLRKGLSAGDVDVPALLELALLSVSEAYGWNRGDGQDGQEHAGALSRDLLVVPLPTGDPNAPLLRLRNLREAIPRMRAFQFSKPTALYRRYADMLRALIYYGTEQHVLAGDVTALLGEITRQLGDAESDAPQGAWTEALSTLMMDTVTSGVDKAFERSGITNLSSAVMGAALSFAANRAASAENEGRQRYAILFTAIIARFTQAGVNDARISTEADLVFREITEQQTTFFRPDPREAEFLSAAMNTMFGAEVEYSTRRDTALPLSVWKVRIADLTRLINRGPINTQERDSEFMSNVWSARERLNMMLSPMTAQTLARCALRMALGEFEELGPNSSSVVPMGLLEKLIFEMVSDVDFLAFRRRRGLDMFAKYDSPFRHMGVAWQVDRVSFDTVTGTATNSFRRMSVSLAIDTFKDLQQHAPQLANELEKLVYSHYASSQNINNAREFFRLVLFGRENNPGVYMGNRAGQPDYTWQISDYIELARFLLEFDDQLDKASARMDRRQTLNDIALRDSLARTKADITQREKQLAADRLNYEETVKLSSAAPTLATTQVAQSRFETRQIMLQAERFSLEAAEARMGIRPSSLIAGVDRAALLHSLFAFMLGYFMPIKPLDILFVQEPSPASTVLFGHFRGDVVPYVGRTVFGIKFNTRSIDRRWKADYRRAAAGLVVGRPSRPTTPFPSSIIDSTWALRRVLVRFERQSNPYNMEGGDLMSGTAFCFSGAQGVGQKINISPLSGVSVLPAPGRPEGRDGLFNPATSGNTFTPQLEYSFWQFQLDRVYYLDPSKARDNTVPSARPQFVGKRIPDPSTASLLVEMSGPNYADDLECFPLATGYVVALDRWLKLVDNTSELRNIGALVQDRPVVLAELANAVPLEPVSEDFDTVTRPRVAQRKAQFDELKRRSIALGGELVGLLTGALPGQLKQLRTPTLVTPANPGFDTALLYRDDGPATETGRFAAEHPEFQYDAGLELVDSMERGMSLYREYISQAMPIILRELRYYEAEAARMRIEPLIFAIEGDAEEAMPPPPSASSASTAVPSVDFMFD